ncbi:MAG: permease prefix domain 1-containing protein [Anaerolineae bacterium]|nr:permease prefix domain 1-containing protein [Anaerolineae bacterium]MCO5207836.1 permease prefix domain 1-containing protein [Anaerolineae bacterium]
MRRLTIDDVLANIQRELNLSKETERDLLDEIRSHLEDAVADAKLAGLDEEAALLKAAEQFGIEEVAPELQAVHLEWESADAILLAAVPVVCALMLRWTVFSAEGSALGWQQILSAPLFWIVAIAALVIPLWQFKRWQYAVAGWGIFWMISLIFIVFPTASQW